MRWQPKFHELYICDYRRQYSFSSYLYLFIVPPFVSPATILAADHTLLLHLLYSVLYAAGERGAALGRPGASGGAHRGQLTPASARCASGHRGPWLGLRSSQRSLGAQAASAGGVRRERGVRISASSPAALWARSLWGTCTWASTCRPAAPGAS